MTNQTMSDQLEIKIRRFESRLEAGIMDWVRNDNIFNSFRSTPARMVIWLLTVAVLYSFPVATLFTDQVPMWVYVVALAFCLLVQKISTRFVFNDHEVIDEYQITRRNNAYRRAYRQVGAILGFVALFCLAGILYQEKGMGSGWVWSIDTYKAEFGLVWVVGLFAIQKYLSWGIKGEPWNPNS
ncbi:MAG: hypothetical protein ACKOXT_04480 [Actinomycetota bacterium]